MDKEKRKKNKAIAKAAKEIQKNRSPNASSYSIDTILAIKRFRDADYTIDMIVAATGKARSTVAHICSSLDRVELSSPNMKQKAIKAAEDILENGDANNKVKIIDRVFQTDKPAKSPAVNINVNAFDKDFSNKEFEFVERVEY